MSTGVRVVSTTASAGLTSTGVALFGADSVAPVAKTRTSLYRVPQGDAPLSETETDHEYVEFAFSFPEGTVHEPDVQSDCAATARLLLHVLVPVDDVPGHTVNRKM